MATHREFRAWHSKARAAHNHNSSISIGKFCGYGIAERAKPEMVGSFYGYHLPLPDFDPLLHIADYRKRATECIRFQRDKIPRPAFPPYRGEYDRWHRRAYSISAGMARLRMVEAAIRMDSACRQTLEVWRLAA